MNKKTPKKYCDFCGDAITNGKQHSLDFCAFVLNKKYNAQKKQIKELRQMLSRVYCFGITALAIKRGTHE